MREYIIVEGEKESPAHCEVGYLRETEAGTWEGKLGKGELSNIEFEPGESISFEYRALSSKPKQYSLKSEREHLYRRSDFSAYGRGDGIDRKAYWGGRSLKTLLYWSYQSLKDLLKNSTLHAASL